MTEEEHALTFDALLHRLKRNDTTLTSFSTHEALEDVLQGSIPFEQRPGLLAKALQSNTQITALDLSHSQFGDSAIAAICNALPRQIRILRLKENDVSDAAAPQIAEAIQNCELQLLDLADNKFSDAGAKSIAAGLKQSSRLEFLDLSENEALTEKGATIIIKSCAACRQLRHLDLGHAATVKNLGDLQLGSEHILPR